MGVGLIEAEEIFNALKDHRRNLHLEKAQPLPKGHSQKEEATAPPWGIAHPPDLRQEKESAFTKYLI